MRLSAVQKLQTSGGIAHPPTDLFPRPPLWVEEALKVDAQQTAASTTVQAIASGPLLLLTTTVPEASAMSADTLRTRVSEAYARIGDALAAFQRQPIRFWNFIPDPGRSMGGGLDRYMIFNTGRAEGYAQWCSASRDLGPSLATASTVGITENELVIHCLASDAGGTAVENPRQKPAWQYSPRYGPTPPCFSRATIAKVHTRPLLLIGGTASVVGEDSLHTGDVGAQLDETLNNIEALIQTACGGQSPTMTALGRIIDLRVYMRRPQDAQMIRSGLQTRCPRANRIELTIARLCRPELLLEIEGVADHLAGESETA